MLQFPFEFQTSPFFLREDFVISEANSQAFSYISQWPDWGEHRFSRLLYLHGPRGAGKTHLSYIWQQQSQAVFIAGSPSYKYDRGCCYILENIEEVISKQKEEGVLHLINNIVENNSFLLITSQFSPAQLPLQLPDLSSRIRALPVVGLSAPDDALLHAVLVKHFSDRQLRIEPEVAAYLLARIERSFISVASIADHLDKKALAEKRNITIPLVREALVSLG